jgi:pimeloyl-ACP methyl ester carboxylesterase
LIGQTRLGAGEPLVLLHALGADRHMWDPVLDRLAQERDVIALDMPGFGKSATMADVARDALAGGDHATGPLEAALVPARLAGGGHDSAPPTGALGPARLAAIAAGGPVAPADLAAAIGAHLAGLGLERPHVAGNSLGGWVALELALAGNARSVTAIAPAGLWEQPLAPKRAAAHATARALDPALPILLKTARGRRLALGGTTAHPERVPYAAALQLVRAYGQAPGFEAANAGMRAGRFTGLAEIAVPLTLAWPEHDRLVGRPRTVPASAREVRLRGCGHMPTWDDPAQVAAVLLDGSAAPRDVELSAER